jgi:CHAT domain-containing protein/Tfp pilus assembly protein PilF
VALLLSGTQADEPPAKAEGAGKPPWQRLLQGDDAKKAQRLQQQITQYSEAAEFDAALKAAEELLALRQKIQGTDHWQAVITDWQRKEFQIILKREAADQKTMAKISALAREADTLRSRGRYREEQPLREQVLNCSRQLLGEEHPLSATSYHNLAANQHAQGKNAEAELNVLKALDLHCRLLGEEYPNTAASYTLLARCQNAQGNYAEAEQNSLKALDLYRKLWGVEHREIASSYNALAANQEAQGKYAEAERNSLKALELDRKLRGEEHPDTAINYHNLALNQQAQGKYAEAERNYRKALDLRLKLRGEEHPDTATCYNNLATNQDAQGKYAEAERNFRKALDLRLKLRGEEHLDTVLSYNNLAVNLNAQGRYAEAERYYLKALDLLRKLQGEEHPHAAQSYSGLALNQLAQGKDAEAEQNNRKALDLHRKLWGEEHPLTATSYHNLASSQIAQGKFAEADWNYRKALDLRLKRLGEEHPDTASSYNGLAGSHYTQGQYAEAERLWNQGADLFDRTRLWIASSGLERATVTSKRSPLLPLAAVLARNQKPQAAWQRYEQSLARGTGDDFAQRRHFSPEDVARRAQLLLQLDRLDRQLAQTLGGKETPEHKQRAKELLGQRLHAQQQLSDSARQLEHQYGAAVGQVLNQADIQKALAADAALLGWVDHKGHPKEADPNGEHWAVLLRAQGDPIWLRLPGSGPDRSWTDADWRLPDDLIQALRQPKSDWQDLARRLGQQRLEPLANHLAASQGLPAVRRLVVLPSNRMDGLPVDLLAEGYTVSYAPSGSLYAYLHDRQRPTSQGLLVLADPVFDPPKAEAAAANLPPGGLLLDVVAPGSNAATAGLKAGDVLLRYADTDLTSLTDLTQALQAHAQDKEVALRFWRTGEAQTATTQPGKLGVVLARDPAPKALADRRQFAKELEQARSADDGDWQPLPGTRIEAEALRRLFAGRKQDVQLLTDSQASEQALDALSRSGALGKLRFVHLATHGLLDQQTPLRSALILSRDKLPDPDQQLAKGAPLYDGMLTAAEVLRDWHLDADLVTLSACQTALGKYEVGESFVGFPQALLLAGARSVCVSLWNVNDTATALLMSRFYQNLLGARDGLKAPLPKAEALAEAQTWLRRLLRSEALKLAAQVTGGVERGKGRPALPQTPVVPGTDKDEPPYAHPYYWAAFVLVGDND